MQPKIGRYAKRDCAAGDVSDAYTRLTYNLRDSDSGMAACSHERKREST